MVWIFSFFGAAWFDMVFLLGGEIPGQARDDICGAVILATKKAHKRGKKTTQKDTL